MNLFLLPCLRPSAWVCGKKRFSRKLLQVLIAHNDYGKFSGEEQAVETAAGVLAENASQRDVVALLHKIRRTRLER